MSVLLKCPSQHFVRLDPDRFWRKTICPRCNALVDRTRLLRAMERIFILFSKRSNGVSVRKESRLTRFSKSSRVRPINDELRFPRLKTQIDRLAKRGWESQESLNAELLLNPSQLPIVATE